MREDRVLTEKTFTIDKLTIGDGSCCMSALLQQMSRPEIFETLNEELKRLVNQMNPHMLRVRVRRFIKNSVHPQIQEFKRNYDQANMEISWNQYWLNILKTHVWGDDIFLQAAAWFIGIDIKIISTTSTIKHPFTVKSGNLEDEGQPTNLTLFLGVVNNRHFQSILPKLSNNNEIEPSNDGCPVCGKKLKNILLHIKKTEMCNKEVSESQMEELRKLSDNNTPSRDTIPWIIHLGIFWR